MTQLGTYDQAKTMLTPVLGDNKGTHLASALTAAVVYSFASLPLVSDVTRGLASLLMVRLPDRALTAIFLNSKGACTGWLTAVPLEPVLSEAGLCQDSYAEPNQAGGWGTAQVQEHLADLVLRLQGGGFHKPLEGIHAVLPPVWHTHGGCAPSKSFRSLGRVEVNPGELVEFLALLSVPSPRCRMPSKTWSSFYLSNKSRTLRFRKALVFQSWDWFRSLCARNRPLR